MIFRSGVAQVVMPGAQVWGAAHAAGGAWWEVAGQTCVAAYQPKGAASLAASYVNLANPGTYDAADGTAPDFAAATGWTFNGSSQYLTTGIVPPNNQTWSAIVRFSDGAATGSRSIFGKYDAASNAFSIYSYETGNLVYYRNGGQLFIGPGLASGVLAIAGSVGYRNGSAETGAIGAPSGTSVLAILIGAINYSPITAYFSGKIQALAIYSTTLSAANVATVTAAMAAL